MRLAGSLSTAVCYSTILTGLVLAACGGEASLDLTGTPRPLTPQTSTPTVASSTATPIRTRTSPAATATSVQEATPTASEAVEPTKVATPTRTGSRTPTDIPTRTRTATAIDTATATFTRTVGTPAGTATATITPSQSPSPTPTFSRTSTATPTLTFSPTVTLTPTTPPSATSTPTSTPTLTPTTQASPTSTPTATAQTGFTTTPTETPADTATPGNSCGNGLLEPGEFFQDPTRGPIGDLTGIECPADAVVQSCTAAEQKSFQVEFTAAIGTVPTSTTVMVGYRSGVLRIPGTGADRDVRGRVVIAPPPPFLSTPTDFDYALRAIIVRTSPLASGLLMTVTFDTCAGADAPQASDLSCYVEGCSGAGGTIDDCACRVVDPNAPTATPTSPPTATVAATDTPTNTPTSSPTNTQAEPPTATPSATAPPPTATPTATSPPPSATPTATTEPPPGPVCGNGFLEEGESFQDPTRGLVGDPEGISCPADAEVRTCTVAEQIAFRIEFEAPVGTVPTSTTVLAGYRSDVVSIPGTGASRDVRGRVVVAPPAPFLSTPTDFDYALRLIIVRTSPIAEGLLATVTFDRCSGAEPPTIADFGCYVEGCSGQGGPIEGCSCRITAP